MQLKEYFLYSQTLLVRNRIWHYKTTLSAASCCSITDEINLFLYFFNEKFVFILNKFEHNKGKFGNNKRNFGE